MKIFFITSKLNFRTSGGSIEEFDLMMRTLQALGDDVTAVTVFSQWNDIPQPLPYPRIEEQFRSNGLVGIQAEIFHLLKKYEREADFFHVDGHLFLYGAGLYRRLGGTVPISAFFNRELMCWPEDRSTLFPPPPQSWRQSIRRRIRWYAEKYIGMPIARAIDMRSFISPMYQNLYEAFGLRGGVNLVIGDPMDFKKIMREASVAEDHYSRRNKKDGVLTIFYSSRMAPGKGFDALLAGFSKVKNKERFRLILGGDGPEEPFVRRMIHELDLEPYVELPGWVPKERLYDYYRRADIFIQADWRFEGTSMSVLYALAFGVPCIVPAGGGLEWNAKGGALCFRYKDFDDLARKIEMLASDSDLRLRLSRGCYQRIADDEINYEKQVGRLHAAMRRLSGNTD